MALIHVLKAFRIWLRIRRENLDNPVQSSDSAVSMRPKIFDIAGPFAKTIIGSHSLLREAIAKRK
jgi:hypothetical protein